MRWLWLPSSGSIWTVSDSGTVYLSPTCTYKRSRSTAGRQDWSFTGDIMTAGNKNWHKETNGSKYQYSLLSNDWNTLIKSARGSVMATFWGRLYSLAVVISATSRPLTSGNEDVQLNGGRQPEDTSAPADTKLFISAFICWESTALSCCQEGWLHAKTQSTVPLWWWWWWWWRWCLYLI